MDYDKIPADEIIQKTLEALVKNGVKAFAVDTGEQAKQKALELIPKGAEVMNMTSVTLETIGVAKEINDSGNYDSVRNKLNALKGDPSKAREQKRLGAAPEYAIGSVHAVSQDGKIFVASNTGSQLGAYLYGSDHVIWVVGAQKIVLDEADAYKRIFKYILPKESVRLRKAYNLPDTVQSFPSKIVQFYREVTKDRITMVIVKEVLGF